MSQALILRASRFSALFIDGTSELIAAREARRGDCYWYLFSASPGTRASCIRVIAIDKLRSLVPATRQAKK